MAPKINAEKRSRSGTQTLGQPATQWACHHHFLSFCVVQNRAAVKHFHPFLLLASLFILLQVLPPLMASSSTVLFQVFLGHSCLLTPWGFRCSAIFTISPFSFLIVWPNQCHFLALVCCIIGCWFLISHRSSSDITSGHLMLKIHHRHLTSLPAISCLKSTTGIY